MEKRFFVKIFAYGYFMQFDVFCRDSAESIENAIIDKIRKNDIKMEYNAFYDDKSLRVTYEEIEDGGTSSKDKRPLQEEEISRSGMGRRP
jgi:hypothetical protein|tara:strand:- start:1784 stop:2053 length:270 start_codon:yes stop_codon:yes gene_type:complete